MRGTRDAMRAHMRSSKLSVCFSISVLWIAILLGVVGFAGCLEASPDGDDRPPASRLVAMWDPLTCATPHRVVLELEDVTGAEVSSSAPCAIGSLSVDLPVWGVYSGRFYGWKLGEPIRGVANVTIMIDAPVIRWQLAAPP